MYNQCANRWSRVWRIWIKCFFVGISPILSIVSNSFIYFKESSYSWYSKESMAPMITIMKYKCCVVVRVVGSSMKFISAPWAIKRSMISKCRHLIATWSGDCPMSFLGVSHSKYSFTIGRIFSNGRLNGFYIIISYIF